MGGWDVRTDERRAERNAMIVVISIAASLRYSELGQSVFGMLSIGGSHAV